MDTMNNVLVCSHFMNNKQQRFHFDINRMVYAIIIIAVFGNTIVPYNVNAETPSNTTDCTTYSKCRECNDVSTCEWSFEKQSCAVSNQSLISDFTRKSCPGFEVTAKSHTMKYAIINVTILEEEDNFKRFLDKNKVECKVDEKIYNATVEKNKTIVCKYELPKTFLDSCIKPKVSRNPLFITYFSIIFNGGVRLKFDESRDHYFAVYPCHLQFDGIESCSVRSDCITAFWNDGPAQYYCNWCLENEICDSNIRQEGKCYARDPENGPSNAGGNASVVRAKGDDVKIERISVSEVPPTGHTTATVKIRGHRVLGRVYDTTTVTVAGLECRNVSTAEDVETITCTVANTTAVVDRGAVVVTYRTSGEPAIELSSADAWSIGSVEPKRSDAVVQSDRLLAGAVVPVGIFSGSVAMLLALLLLVKTAITRSRRQSKKWYKQQLRDITAGIEEEEL